MVRMQQLLSSQQQVLNAVLPAAAVMKGGMLFSEVVAVPSMTHQASTCSNLVSIPLSGPGLLKLPVDHSTAALADVA